MFYYAADGKQFSTKIEALLYQKNTGQHIQCYYHDDVYSKLDWKQEPYPSLPELYKMQAQRIRDTYDRVILCYSGGYDSTQVLETFVYNGIKLDKIITVGAFSQDSSSDSDANMNIEAYKNAFPYLEKLGLQSIHEIIDYTKYFANPCQLSLFEYGSEWVDQLGTWLSPHNLFWRDVEKFVVPPAWRDKKNALVFGIERPYPFGWHEGHYRFAFKDTHLNTYGNTMGTDYCDRIYFFWDVNFPDIVVKQLHVWKNIVETCKSKLDATRFNLVHEVRKIIEQPRIINGRDVSPLYNIRNPLVIKSPKSTDRLLSGRDRYFTRATNTPIHDFYRAGIDRYQSKVGTSEAPVFYTQYYYLT